MPNGQGPDYYSLLLKAGQLRGKGLDPDRLDKVIGKATGGLVTSYDDLVRLNERGGTPSRMGPQEPPQGRRPQLDPSSGMGAPVQQYQRPEAVEDEQEAVHPDAMLMARAQELRAAGLSYQRLNDVIRKATDGRVNGIATLEVQFDPQAVEEARTAALMQIQSDPGRAALRNFLDTASFGTVDEIGGGLRGILAMVPGGDSPKEAYTKRRDEMRTNLEADELQYPEASFVGDAAGMLVPGAPIARGVGKVATPLVKAAGKRVAAGATKVRRMNRAADAARDVARQGDRITHGLPRAGRDASGKLVKGSTKPGLPHIEEFDPKMLKKGEKFFSRSGQQIGEEMMELSKKYPDLAQYQQANRAIREGFTNAMEIKLREGGTTVARKLLSDQNKLKAMFGQDADALIKLLTRYERGEMGRKAFITAAKVILIYEGVKHSAGGLMGVLQGAGM